VKKPKTTIDVRFITNTFNYFLVNVYSNSYPFELVLTPTALKQNGGSPTVQSTYNVEPRGT
jgi:hypothetical protein